MSLKHTDPRHCVQEAEWQDALGSGKTRVDLTLRGLWWRTDPKITADHHETRHADQLWLIFEIKIVNRVYEITE